MTRQQVAHQILHFYRRSLLHNVSIQEPCGSILLFDRRRTVHQPKQARASAAVNSYTHRSLCFTLGGSYGLRLLDVSRRLHRRVFDCGSWGVHGRGRRISVDGDIKQCLCGRSYGTVSHEPVQHHATHTWHTIQGRKQNRCISRVG